MFVLKELRKQTGVSVQEFNGIDDFPVQLDAFMMLVHKYYAGSGFCRDDLFLCRSFAASVALVMSFGTGSGLHRYGTFPSETNILRIAVRMLHMEAENPAITFQNSRRHYTGQSEHEHLIDRELECLAIDRAAFFDDFRDLWLFDVMVNAVRHFPPVPQVACFVGSLDQPLFKDADGVFAARLRDVCSGSAAFYDSMTAFDSNIDTFCKNIVSDAVCGASMVEYAEEYLRENDYAVRPDDVFSVMCGLQRLETEKWRAYGYELPGLNFKKTVYFSGG